MQARPKGITHQEREQLGKALFHITKIRYSAFCERFGRSPEPDEPLLFDPVKKEPTLADVDDQILQIMSAALVSEVEPRLVLDYLGLRLTS